jgi:hypothetical protein
VTTQDAGGLTHRRAFSQEALPERDLFGAQRGRTAKAYPLLLRGETTRVGAFGNQRALEFERELIHERTQSGRVAARARGVCFGRHRKLTGEHIKLAQRLIDEGRSVPEVARILKVHRTTLYRALLS